MDTPKEIFLKDYKQPDYFFDTVDLKFSLGEEKTIVCSEIAVYSRVEGCSAPLVLDGVNLKLITIKINGKELKEEDFSLDSRHLIVHSPPSGKFTLQTVTEIYPQKNTSLEGLYKSSGNFCTQCEAEGFRKITFYQDRPDVMAKYTCRIEADKSLYPVLLSNGNLIEQGDLEGGKHYTLWEDPFKKPCYLFALVAGQLESRDDTFTTRSGRKVSLRIWTPAQDLPKTAHAMYSLKAAMKWDEDVFGLQYDLDLFNIVAVPDFNMGAMENKSLNIFNSKLVLASPETATDGDYSAILGVIGHEYFHNWTGNRVTCRDWFQLSLKEGLTVFRDQEFSSDMGSRTVKRIADVSKLRTYQFPQDAGPMAHPVRPHSYIKMDNFYTVTVYEKGAEVVRMYKTLLGSDGFRKGMDLYFERHDGQAVTCEEFFAAMRDANGADFSNFLLWYSQAGTPRLKVVSSYNTEARTYSLKFSQEVPATPGQPVKEPMFIPVAVGLLDSNGKDLPLSSVYHDGQLESIICNGQPVHTTILRVTKKEEEFVFNDIPERPVPSILRGYSAPVRLESDLSEADLFVLLANDSDEFNRIGSYQSGIRALDSRAMATKFSKEIGRSWRQEGDRARGSGLDSVGRLDISIFYGGDPDWWLEKADEIFARNQLSEREKVEAATACWCGEAWEWFLWIKSRRPIRTWDELKSLLRDQFRKKVSMVEEIPVHKLETRMERHQLEVQDDPKSEIKKAMSAIMEKFDSVIAKMRQAKRSEQDVEEVAGESRVQEKKSVAEPERERKEREIAENSPEPAIFEITNGFAKHHRRNSEIPTPAIPNSINQKRMRHGHAGKEGIPRRGASSRVEDGGFDNGLTQGKIMEDQFVKLEDMVWVREVAQQVNQALGEMGLNKIKIKGPATTYSPKTHHVTPVLSPDLLQLGKRLYHRWKEKNTIQRHNEEEPSFFSINIRGCQTTEVSWESVAALKHQFFDFNPADRVYLEEIQEDVAAPTLPKAVMNKNLEGEGSGSILKEIICGHSGPTSARRTQECGKWTEIPGKASCGGETTIIGQTKEGNNPKLEIRTWDQFRILLRSHPTQEALLLLSSLEEILVTGLKSHTWAEVCPLRPNGLGFILEMAQLGEGKLLLKQAQEKPGPVCNINLFSSCNRNTLPLSPILKTANFSSIPKWVPDPSLNQKWGILLVGATGYGVALDTILVIDVQLNSNFAIKCDCWQIQSSDQIVLNKMTGLDFHLEDKVVFEAAGNDRIQSSSLILEDSRKGENHLEERIN